MKEETKLVGNIGIDAGLCWIGDPRYVLPDGASERENVSNWSEFCDNLGDEHPTMISFDYSLGHEGLGVCVSTGYGDGLYPVYATISDDPQWGKRIKKITIVFIADEDELEARTGKGKWVWADLYDPDESVEDHPENPNVNCFTKVWLPEG